VASVDLRQSTIFSRLRGLLDVTRLVRGGEELPALLHEIARTVSDSLGYRTVVVNLYRREWDDLVVSTVYGSEDARDALLGQVREVVDWEPLLDERFLQRGVYLVRAGDFDWSEYAGSVYTPDLAISEDPSAWHPDDALFAPLRATDGSLLGILSVDEPLSGRRPSGDEIDVLVAVSEHAALAVQSAQEDARAKANRDALEQLLQVSTRLNESHDALPVLERVCGAISEALGFQKVAVQLLGDDGCHHTAAVAGFAEGENMGEAMAAGDLDRILQPEYDVAGCFLLEHEQARALLPSRAAGYRSKSDGRGPYAWQNHWLFVPLHDRRGRRIGYVWADDPVDRLRPEEERLRILRAFANQATTALEQTAQFEEIQKAGRYHRALIEAFPDAIIDFDLDGRVRSWNGGATRIFGFTADEVIGRLSPIVPPEEREGFAETLRRVAGGEVLEGLDLRRLHKDGSTIDVIASAAPVRNAQGEAEGVICSMTDVTSRKRSERALAASEGRKDAILRAALDPVVVVDHEGLVTEMNPAAEETFGLTRVDALGTDFLSTMIAPEHRDALAPMLETGTGALLGTRLELTALRSDHRTFSAELAITRVDVPGPLLFAVSLRDVTKRLDQEGRMRHAEAKYRALVEQLPLVTYSSTASLPAQVTHVSPQIEALLGYPASDWLKPEFRAQVLHPDDRETVAAAVQRAYETGEGLRLEYRLIAADGRTVRIRDEAVFVRDDEYRPILLQGHLVDVTDSEADDDVEPLTLRSAG
jgi:PAS domain S-box-containing protein